MNPFVTMALKKASEIRRQNNFDMYQPINIFDLCTNLGLTVRFVDINMEGMYIQQENGMHPQILLSNQRPLPRRFFTCAHELGHHLFGHGTKIDALIEEGVGSTGYDKDEFLVDTFAGALLMPVSGILAEFAKRNWSINNARPLQFYTISSFFGTGYQSLITHCRVNKVITEQYAITLLKTAPSKILSSILGSGVNNSHFKIVDVETPISVIDLEVANFIFLPEHIKPEGAQLIKYKDTSIGTAYVAEKPGIVRAASLDNTDSFFIRIQNANYIGLAEYRHLETITA